jgi:hypothetical protein
MIGGSAYLERIGEVDRKLSKVIDYFDRAMNVGTLRLANETSYYRDLRCMDDTRQSLLNQMVDWAANKSEYSPEEYVLVLWLAQNRKKGLSPFDLCKPSRARPPCWSRFLPEGRPELERTQNHPSVFVHFSTTQAPGRASLLHKQGLGIALMVNCPRLSYLCG